MYVTRDIHTCVNSAPNWIYWMRLERSIYETYLHVLDAIREIYAILDVIRDIDTCVNIIYTCV